MWTVLIADDYPVVRDIFRELFNSFPQSFKVVGEASTGEEAVEIATAKKPDFIIMDITMPLMDGLTATKIIKKELGLHSMVLTYSGYPKASLKEMAKRAGSRDHFTKPLNLLDLKEKMLNQYGQELGRTLKEAI